MFFSFLPARCLWSRDGETGLRLGFATIPMTTGLCTIFLDSPAIVSALDSSSSLFQALDHGIHTVISRCARQVGWHRKHRTYIVGILLCMHFESHGQSSMSCRGCSCLPCSRHEPTDSCASPMWEMELELDTQPSDACSAWTQATQHTFCTSSNAQGRALPCSKPCVLRGWCRARDANETPTPNGAYIQLRARRAHGLPSEASGHPPAMARRPSRWHVCSACTSPAWPERSRRDARFETLAALLLCLRPASTALCAVGETTDICPVLVAPPPTPTPALSPSLLPPLPLLPSLSSPICLPPSPEASPSQSRAIRPARLVEARSRSRR